MEAGATPRATGKSGSSSERGRKRRSQFRPHHHPQQGEKLTTSAQHVDTAEGAALIRKALKKAFPKTQFSVRISRYSMGSSVDVRWTNGPSQRLVGAVLAPFETKHFDGIDDSTRFTSCWLTYGDEVRGAQPIEGLSREIYFSFYLP